MRIKHSERNSRDVERDLLSLKELNTLFMKITPIINAHAYIQEALQRSISNWNNNNLIGKIWADFALDLERVYIFFLYFSYVSRFIPLISTHMTIFYGLLTIASSINQNFMNFSR